ncbi:MAG: glycosyltransferase family 39 protein [Spirosomataceae bacterium]
MRILYSERFFFVGILALMLLAYFGIGTYRHLPYKIEGDGKYYYQYLVSGFYDHDLDFSNNYRQPKYDWMATELDNYQLRDMVNAQTKRPANLFSTGVAILWLPFFLLAFILSHVFHAVGLDIDLNPWGKFFQYTVMLASVVYGWLTLRLWYEIAKHFFDKQLVIIALWLISFLSPFFYYAAVESSMSHVYDVFAYTLLLWCIVRSRQTNYTQYLPWVAVAAAVSVLVRTQNAPSIALMGVFVWIDYYRITKHWLSARLLITAFVFLLCILPFPLTNLYLFGKPFTVPQGSHFMIWDNPQLLNLLFSWRNGFFSYHPLLLVGFIGYGAWLYQRFQQKDTLRWLWLVMMMAFLGQVYVNACVIDWWAGHSFGQRRLLSSLPLFVLGLCWVIDAANRRWNLLIHTATSPTLLLLCGLGIYLMFIHIFIWNYEEPHNIYTWIFYTAPTKLASYFGGN